ncbi:MAG: exodeoxyribonuclease III [Alphaproteobacteria bacterium]|nr:exodeoxyribonuclease III [Alphaproteobacteria bacterium]
MKIATWNVNSVKARLPIVLEWLRAAAPDVVLLQEIKTVAEDFPRLEFEDLGYNLAIVGQKTYNGVAILSKRPLEDVSQQLAGDAADTEARYVEAFVAGVRVASIYVPQGTEVGSDRFRYKLAFLDRLHDRFRRLLRDEERFAFGGDYNVAPEPGDVHDAERLDGTLCYHPEERARFRALLHLGLTDAFRALNHEQGRYSWWDYRAGGWQKDHGMRIDHLLLSPQAADRLVAADIDRAPRGRPKASDHTPVWCELSDVPLVA